MTTLVREHKRSLWARTAPGSRERFVWGIPTINPRIPPPAPPPQAELPTTIPLQQRLWSPQDPAAAAPPLRPERGVCVPSSIHHGPPWTPPTHEAAAEPRCCFDAPLAGRTTRAEGTAAGAVAKAAACCLCPLTWLVPSIAGALVCVPTLGADWDGGSLPRAHTGPVPVLSPSPRARRDAATTRGMLTRARPSALSVSGPESRDTRDGASKRGPRKSKARSSR